MSKESKEEVRDKTDDIVEERKLGKLGMKEQPLIGQILSPAGTTLLQSIGSNCQFSSHGQRRHRVLCKGVDTSHGNVNNSRLGEDGEVGEVFENRPRVRLWYKFQEIPYQLEETFSDTDWEGCRKHTPQHNRRIHSCRISSHQNVVQNTSRCGSQFCGSELYGLVRASAQTVWTHIDVQRPRHAYEWSGTGRRERRPRHCGPTRLGKLRHLDTNYMWIQEKAAKGDLNFKKVAGVDNGAHLFTKTLSWNEIQSHIHKLSSQFIQDEINVNFVGARPNGVNLPQVLQELVIAGGRNLAPWTRTDMSS